MIFGRRNVKENNMTKIIDKIDSGLGKLYEGDVHLPVKRIWVWINRVETAIVLLMFAFAYGMMIAGSVLDRVDLIVVGFASLCVPMVLVPVHECGHYVAVWALGGTPETVLMPVADEAGAWNVMAGVRDLSGTIYCNPAANALATMAGSAAVLLVGFLLVCLLRTNIFYDCPKTNAALIGFTLPYVFEPTFYCLTNWIAGDYGDFYILDTLGIPFWLSFAATFILGSILVYRLIEPVRWLNGALYGLGWEW